MDGNGGETGTVPSRRRAVARWLWRGASVLVFVLVLDYLVLPQLAGTERSLHLLRTANLTLLVAAVALEAASLVSYSLLTHRMVPGNQVGLGWVLRADLTGLGVSHALPGGAATGNAMRFGLLHEGGVGASDAAVGLTLEGVLSTAVVAVLLWVALVVSIPFYGPSPAYVTGAVVGALLMAAIALAVVGYARRGALVPGVARRVIARMPSRVRPRLERAFDMAGGQVRELLGNAPNLRAATGWAARAAGVLRDTVTETTPGRSCLSFTPASRIAGPPRRLLPMSDLCRSVPASAGGGLRHSTGFAIRPSAVPWSAVHKRSHGLSKPG